MTAHGKTHARYQVKQRIAQAYKAALAEPPLALHMLRLLMVLSLNAQQSAVYEYICNHGDTVTTDIMQQFGWKLNHASTILKELAGYALVTRRQVRDNVGKHWIYSIPL